jgi:phosphate starvation-inducible membrane PsiE
MAGKYFQTNHIPLRFSLFVEITETTRQVIGKVQKDASPDASILLFAGAKLVLSLAVFTIRYAAVRFSASSTIERTLTD